MKSKMFGKAKIDQIMTMINETLAKVGDNRVRIENLESCINDKISKDFHFLF
jgi:hypothetical protein